MEQENSYLLDKKIDYLINMKFGKITGQLNAALMKIDEMGNEINVLKNKIQRLDTGVHVQKTLTDVQKETAGRKEVRKEESFTNPRGGGINPDDVSVEKMFYFGNK